MRHIDIHALADGARFNRFHAGILAWCALIIICDGYDLAVAGIALPSIMKEMGVTAQNAGFMVSAALFGMMFGAIFLGTIADRIGRRHAIVICLALFSVFTAAAGMSSDPYVFSAMRFLAGLGVGLAGASTIGTQIVTYAYAGQFYPTAIRSTGIGWASGVGRSGAILAPIVIGTLVGMALPLQQNFQAMAIPAVIAAVSVALIRHGRSASAAPRHTGAVAEA